MGRYALKNGIFCVLVATLVLMNGVGAAHGREFLFATEDLFYFKDDTKVPAPLAPKVLIRSTKEGLTELERASLMKELSASFSAIGVTEEKNSPLGEVSFLTFFPDISQDRILEIVREISSMEHMQAAPVFIVENREAVVSGIVIEPKLYVQPAFIESELNRMFGAQVRQISRKESASVVLFKELFFFSKTKMPLNVLGLANIAHVNNDGPWIKRVEPNFWFLSESISVSMWVYPLTGTISQERTLSLAVTFYDPATKFDEQLVPLFGKGSFAPQSENKFPPDTFFKILENQERQEYVNSRGKTILFRWRFKLFVPKKEWTISAQKIFYEGKNSGEVVSNVTTFVTLAHTGMGIAIADIPATRPIVAPQPKILVSPPVVVPTFWFDEMFASPHVVAKVGLLLGLVSVVLVLSFAFFSYLRKVWAKKLSRNVRAVTIFPAEKRIQDMRNEIKECADIDFCEGLEKILGSGLRFYFPALPEGFTSTAVKDLVQNDAKARIVLGKEDGLMDKLEDITSALAERFAHGFAMDKEQKSKIADSVLHFLRLLKVAVDASAGDAHNV